MTVHLKNVTAQLRNQERMAAIGQTAGMVGHDLRNPLQTITGEVYLAKNELQELPPSDQKNNLIDNINAIDEQIVYMDKIVSDLQSFVRPVDVHKVTFDVKQFIADRLAESHIPITIKTVLQIENGLRVYADEQLTKRVIFNLITNSVQAMPNGGQLTIKAQTKNLRVLISVEDTGVGIPEEVKPKLFTPLFTTKSRGQGFGLAVCKRVIEAQGGTISFESEVGKGAKFTIELPKD
jgi:signal transduction histidine kinase